MRVALRELRRRPSRFLAAGGALTLLVVLLLVLGAFLDGLYLGATGALRAQDDALVVFDGDARAQLARSSVDGADAAAAAGVDGADAVAGLGLTPTVAQRPGAEPADVVVAGYERATSVLPAPPVPGRAIADRRLAELAGVALGDVLEVGLGATPVEVVGWVEDTTSGQPTLWVAPATWREVAAASNPAGAPAEDAFQALLVTPAPGADPTRLAGDVDAATGGTSTVPLDEAIRAIPGVEQQQQVFTGIIGVTFAVAGLVVALFFVLITLERTRLYAVLKAVGARSRDLVAGVVAQAVGVALGALALGGALGVALVAVVPPELPVRLVPSRVAAIAAGILLTAVLGSLVTLRRILRIDPAASIG